MATHLGSAKAFEGEFDLRHDLLPPGAPQLVGLLLSPHKELGNGPNGRDQAAQDGGDEDAHHILNSQCLKIRYRLLVYDIF